jgi:hypothetical protein
MAYRHGASTYHVEVENGGPEPRLWLDGEIAPRDFITLVDDGKDHTVSVRNRARTQLAG